MVVPTVSVGTEHETPEVFTRLPASLFFPTCRPVAGRAIRHFRARAAAHAFSPSYSFD
jgi:hypothetical protein